MRWLSGGSDTRLLPINLRATTAALRGLKSAVCLLRSCGLAGHGRGSVRQPEKMCSNYLNIQHPSSGLQTITQKQLFLPRSFTQPCHTACCLSLSGYRKTVVDVQAEHLGSLVKKKPKKHRQQKEKKKKTDMGKREQNSKTDGYDDWY